MFHGFRHVVPLSSFPVAPGGLGFDRGGSTTLTHSALRTPQRFSFKYATKPQHNEMRQPAYIHDKRFGVFSYERHIGKARRGLPHVTPMYTKHMNLWETDTDATSNRYFRSYVFGQRELHQLCGRPHGFEAAGTAGQHGLSGYELQHDMRYRGVRAWPQSFRPGTLYRDGQHGSAAVVSHVAASQNGKGAMDCRAWFARLQHLIDKHYDAVGDVGPYESRHTRHVHQFFVAFHDALSREEDGGVAGGGSYMLAELQRCRPAALSDLFAIFIEMEANSIHTDYCPRCSLPYARTRYCGEGEPDTPFRRHRGRWAEHPRWGAEWFRVVVHRAEALWRRAGEDPFFGTARRTQRQVAAMLRVYVKARERGKAVDFIHRTRGSQEFLLGEVGITAEMAAAVEELLDETPHPHMLTNGFVVQGRAAAYLGSGNSGALAVPHSPMQMRLDLELDKARRTQRECGAVRVPPALWRIDTASIVPYTVDGRTGKVNNWRAVKEGIERSFVATGLPPEAYTSAEQREMAYWRVYLAQRAANRAALAAQQSRDEALVAAHNQHGIGAVQNERGGGMDHAKRNDDHPAIHNRVGGLDSDTTHVHLHHSAEKCSGYRDDNTLETSCGDRNARTMACSDSNSSSSSSGTTATDSVGCDASSDARAAVVVDALSSCSTDIDGLDAKELLRGEYCVPVVFPDRHWYRVFDATPARLAREFGLSVSGTVYVVMTHSFADAAAVPYTDRATGQTYTFDTTAEACRVFGGYESGDVLIVSAPRHAGRGTPADAPHAARVGASVSGPPAPLAVPSATPCTPPVQPSTSTANDCANSMTVPAHGPSGSPCVDQGVVRRVDDDRSRRSEKERVTVVVVGVNTEGPESERMLYAMYADAALHARHGLLALGSDVHDMARRMCGGGETAVTRCYPAARSIPLRCLDGQRTVREESVGQVVGVRGGVLYMQWWHTRGGDSVLDRGVAVPLGTAAEVAKRYRFLPYSSQSSRTDGANALASAPPFAQTAPPCGAPRASLVPAGGGGGGGGGVVVESEVLPLREPASWRVFFRNDRAEERLRALEQAPFAREEYGSLIRNKYTPVRKRFGYAQHTTQDDFATTEYHDRLLSRQFFHNPQAFAVIPERRESAVHYAEDGDHAPQPTTSRGGNPNSILPDAARSAPSRVCGLPTVDRREMEHGWSSCEPIGAVEVAVIEQALRDISGDRPGNRVKTRQEVSALRLNEPWWAMLQHGWSQANREQRAVVREGSERALVDRARLPYGGTSPPFGTSYGIGERIRAVVADYAAGFGRVGGGGAGTHSTRRGLVGALVRLFDAKLQESHGGDAHAWGLEMAAEAGNGHGLLGDVRHILLALHEWRDVGRRPSLLLQQLLARYLHAEVAAFNAGVPAGVPRLNLQPSRANAVSAAESESVSVSVSAAADAGAGDGGGAVCELEDSIWCDVPRQEYRIDYAQRRWGRDSEQSSDGVSYIVQLVHRAETAIATAAAAASLAASGSLVGRGDDGAGDDGAAGARTPYAAYAASASQERFEQSLWSLVNQGIPQTVLAHKCSQLHRGSVRNSGAVATLVRASFLAALLHRRGVSSGDVAVVMRGLANTAEQEPLPDGSDFMVPVSLVLSWPGPSWALRKSGAAAVSTRRSPHNYGQGGHGSRNDQTAPIGSASEGSGSRGRQTLHQALYGKYDAGGGGRRGDGGATEDKMVVDVLDELALCDDGFVMDVRYTIRENRRNAVLRNEFCAAFLPVVGHDVARVRQLYEDYCEGKYVPNVSVAIEAFVAFLVQISAPGYDEEAAAPHAARATSRCDGDSDGVNVHYMQSPVVPYLDKTADGRTQLRLLPPELGSFQFENTLAETAETVALFARYGIAAGPTRVSSTGFIAATSKSLNYFTRRREEVVYVTLECDHGLGRALRNSPYYDTRIARHPALRALLLSPPPSSSSSSSVLSSAQSAPSPGSGTKDRPTTSHPVTANAALVACFNRFYFRVTPMLSFYQGVLAHYTSRVGRLSSQAQVAHRRLARVLDAEASSTLEQSFRRHAERYWRMLLEGRSAEETSLIASTTASPSSSSSSTTNTSSTRTTATGSNAASRSVASSSSSSSSSSGSSSTAVASAAKPRVGRVGGEVVETTPQSPARSGSRSMNDLLTRLRAPVAGGEKRRGTSGQSRGTAAAAAAAHGKGSASMTQRRPGGTSGVGNNNNNNNRRNSPAK